MSTIDPDEIDLRAQVGEGLKRARGYSLLSQAELARKVHISRRALIDYESGEKAAPITTVIRISSVTNVPVERILENVRVDERFSANGWFADVGIEPYTQLNLLAHCVDDHRRHVDVDERVDERALLPTAQAA